MQYIQKDLGSYNLHMIKTDKYKTITVRVIFRRRIKKEEITIRNILTSLLVYSTKKYDSKRKITIAAEDLYSAGITIDNNRLGNYLCTTLTLNVLNDKYTEKGNFNKSLAFLNEIIFAPDVENQSFKEKYLEIIKNSATTKLVSLKENLSEYSTIRAMESFDKESPSSYRMVGYLEDLDQIDGKALYSYYKEMITKDIVDIVVIGNIDEDKIYQEIKKYFNLRILKKIKADYYLDIKKPRRRRLFAKETVPANQSQVNVICRISKLTDYEKNYVLPIYNIILGSGADSKLFKIVREKNSLCYSIYSVTNKLDNLLVIKTGINVKNYQKTIILIEKIMKDMQKGKFNIEDINTAKEFYKTTLDEIEESPISVINSYLAIVYLGTDDIENKKENILRVTKNEIVRVAKKIHMDTIFTLEGDKDEKAGI